MIDETDLVFRLRKRSEIRKQIGDRKSVQEGKVDRLCLLLEEAADEIESLRQRSPGMRYWRATGSDILAKKIWSEDQIIDTYYQSWSNRSLNRLVASDEINKANCIKDWCAMRNAIQVDENGNEIERNN
jgi:hypothetical protein